MTTPETEAEVTRLFQAEHWRVGTISSQLGLHPDVVRRILGIGEPGEPRVRPSLVAPFSAFIDEVLKSYPRLRATRLYDMLRERGYKGSVRTLRDHVARVRPRGRREVFLRLETMPGEQAQIDWAHVGKLPVIGGERDLWAFVLVLSHSRAMWAELVLDLSVFSLCRSLVRASVALGGVTRQWLFDNPKTVVLERHGDAVRFHPTLLELCAAMRVQPRLCAVGRPEHKGRVERSIRYLRDRFFTGRVISSVEQGNRELLAFLDEIALPRPHPTLPGRTVRDCLAEERPRLLPLPTHTPCTNQLVPVVVDKTAFCRFDTNSYSVPPEHVRKTLTLTADDQEVRLVEGSTLVARHPRCWGRRQVVEVPEHREALLALKQVALEPKGRDRLRAAVPGIDTLYERWVEVGRNLGSMTARTLKLLDLYGAELLAAAVAQVLERGLHDPGALAALCEQRRVARSAPVPLDVPLAGHVHDRDVIPHALETYDEKP